VATTKEVYRAKLFPYKCAVCKTTFRALFFGAKCPTVGCAGDWLIIVSYNGVPDGYYRGTVRSDY
jgi:hypothetical protein